MTWHDLGPWLADALVLFGALVMTIGVIGAIRLPDTYAQVHAAGNAVFFGTLAIGVASLATGRADTIARVLLIFVVLLITTPVSSHVIARAAWLLREPQAAAGAIDESERLGG